MEGINVERIDTEILPFLSSEARTDVRAIALQYFLGLTGTEDGRKFLSGNPKYLSAIISRMEDEQLAISKDAYLALVNLTSDDGISQQLMELNPNLVEQLLLYIIQKDSLHADIACSIMSNVSRPLTCAQKIVDLMIKQRDKLGFDKIVFAFCQIGYNPKNKLHYLGSFLSNLTQIKDAREEIMDQGRCVIQRLLPFLEYKDSVIRRGGIIGTLKNCCFEVGYHEWALSDDVDILPRLLLPLAGPDVFDDEDNEKLPLDLQYLEPNKEREPDPDLRKMLIETIFQLCTLKPCRLFIKEKNTYVILRELYEWEKDPAAKCAAENLIQLLIGDEPEPGMENLNEVKIPEDIKEQLAKTNIDISRKVNEEPKRMKLGEG